MAAPSLYSAMNGDLSALFPSIPAAQRAWAVEQATRLSPQFLTSSPTLIGDGVLQLAKSLHSYVFGEAEPAQDTAPATTGAPKAALFPAAQPQDNEPFEEAREAAENRTIARRKRRTEPAGESAHDKPKAGARGRPRKV